MISFTRFGISLHAHGPVVILSWGHGVCLKEEPGGGEPMLSVTGFPGWSRLAIVHRPSRGPILYLDGPARVLLTTRPARFALNLVRCLLVCLLDLISHLERRFL